MNSFSLRQGTQLRIEVELRDDANALAPYDLGSFFQATVWPGNDRQSSFQAQVDPTDPDNALITITVGSAQSAALDRGRYQLLAEITPPGGEPAACYQCSIEVEAVAGLAIEPPTYCTYEDLLKYGRGWLRQLASIDDEAGFSAQRARARTWLEDVAHAHYSWSVWARSTILRDALEANTLIVTDQVREACARKALEYICEAQVGLGDDAAQYARLARMYHAQADGMACCLVLELDRDGDGLADSTIDCTVVRPLEG